MFSELLVKWAYLLKGGLRCELEDIWHLHLGCRPCKLVILNRHSFLILFLNLICFFAHSLFFSVLMFYFWTIFCSFDGLSSWLFVQFLKFTLPVFKDPWIFILYPYYKVLWATVDKCLWLGFGLTETILIVL